MIDENKNNQPLDLSYLREMSGDSADFMIEMLDAFQKQTPIYMDTSECAHKMKPTFFYVGRVDVRDHMQEIERNSRELKDIDKIPNEFNKAKAFVTILYKQLADAKTELEKHL